LGIGETPGFAPQLFEEDSILFPQILNDSLLVAVDPADDHEKKDLELCIHGRQQSVRDVGSQAPTLLRLDFLALQALHSGGQEEKVLYSSGICSGVSVSLGPNQKTQHRAATLETPKENPTGRRLRREKKEQEFLLNLSKKTKAKKIHLLTARFASIPFRPSHSGKS
jgi:hypothetical protein